MRFQTLPLLSTLLLATPTLQHSFAKTRTIYQFPKPTWIENIITTSSGSLLVTLINPPEVHLIDPVANSSSLVASFPGTTATLGITEYEPNVFAVITGNFSFATAVTEPGSYSVWSVDLRNGTSIPDVSEIAAIPEAGLLNGMATLDSETLLISESKNGLVYRLDVTTGEYSVAIDDATMKGVEGFNFGIGVNGIKVNGGYVYFTNSGLNSFYRVPIDSTGLAVGVVETIASNFTSLCDDFDVTDDGTAFVNDEGSNAVKRVELSGKITTIAGGLNSTVVPGPTSARLGRTWRDRNILYVGTNGAVDAPVGGTYSEGGKILALSIN